jgi:hypothetical protein
VGLDVGILGDEVVYVKRRDKKVSGTVNQSHRRNLVYSKRDFNHRKCFSSAQTTEPIPAARRLEVVAQFQGTVLGQPKSNVQ